MPDYMSQSQPPHVGAQNWIYDTNSGYYRTVISDDFKLQNANGSISTTIDPVAVKMGGSSAAPFGEVLTANLIPHIEAYLNDIEDSRIWNFFSGSNDGYKVQESGQAKLSIGNSLLAYSSAQTKQTVPYSPGEGVVVRFTAAFNSGVANSLQLVGPYHVEDGFGVGYNGTEFGFFHRYGRKLHIVKLNIPSGAVAGGTATVTLNGTPNTVNINSLGGAANDARDIATGASYIEDIGLTTFKYDTMSVSGDVYFIRQIHGPITGEFSFNGGTSNASGNFSIIQSGVDGTTNWVYQDDFSYDKLNGSGASNMTINPQKLNIYEIKYGWLGALPIKFSVANETCQEMIPVHVISWANQQEYPSVFDPRFPIGYSVASAGSTTPMAIRGASCSAFVTSPPTNKVNLTNKRFAYNRNITAGTSLLPAFSIQTPKVSISKSKINRQRVVVTDIIISNESSTKTGKVFIYLGTELNLKNFIFAQENGSNAQILIDYQSNGLTTSGASLVSATSVAPTSQSIINLDYRLDRGQVLIVAAQTNSSTAPLDITIKGYEDS